MGKDEEICKKFASIGAAFSVSATEVGESMRRFTDALAEATGPVRALMGLLPRPPRRISHRGFFRRNSGRQEYLR